MPTIVKSELFAKLRELPGVYVTLEQVIQLCGTIEYKITRKKVSNAEIKEYLAVKTKPVSVAQIMDFLGYHPDDTTEVCARLGMMEKRKNQHVASVVIDRKKHYFILRG